MFRFPISSRFAGLNLAWCFHRPLNHPVVFCQFLHGRLAPNRTDGIFFSELLECIIKKNILFAKAIISQDLRSAHAMRLCLQFGAKAVHGFYTHSLRLTQHLIDTMSQFEMETRYVYSEVPCMVPEGQGSGCQWGPYAVRSNTSWMMITRDPVPIPLRTDIKT